MSVQLVYSRAGCGKTHYVTSEIQKRFKDGKKSYLVVPEQYTHIAEHKLLSAVGSISTRTVEVSSFKKMIDVAKRISGITEVLSPMTKSIIIADILTYTELEYFSLISSHTGFVDICSNLISEFKKYCITPPMLRSAIDGMENQRLKIKLSDILKIYREYLLRIEEKGFDSDDGANVLSENIANVGDYGDTVFYFDEFTSFIPQEMSIIREIAKKAEEVVITLCTDGDDELLFAPISDTVKKLKQMCEEAHIEMKEPIKLTGNKKHSGEIAFIEKNLFPYPMAKYDGDTENVSISSSANPYEEVCDVARRIIRLCRDGNYRFREIGVVCADIGTYAPYIAPVFKNHNISYFIDEKSPVLNHAIVRYLLNILDIYLYDYSNETVFAFLKSGFCDADRDGVNALENYCRRTNMHKNTWLNDDKWNELIIKRTVNNDEAEKICRIRDEYIKPLSEFHNSVKGRHKTEHMCMCLYNYIISTGLATKIQSYLKDFEKEQNVRKSEEYEKIWSILIDAIDTISDVMEGKTINVKTFRALLETSFSGYSIGLIPTSLDEVFVGNISRSKSDGIKALFVLGANDGVFPSPINTDDIINDGDKLCLKEQGIELSMDMTKRAFFERFYMYTTFAIPSEKLFISFSRADINSEGLRPSFVLSDFKRLFPDLIFESDILEDDSDFGQMDYITTVSPTMEKLVEKITQYRNGEKISDVWFDVYDYFCKNYDLGRKIENYYTYTNRAEDIDQKLIDAVVPKEFHTTISKLQRYRACKFSYFLEYVLKLEENTGFDVTSMDTGTFVHSVIENLCKNMDGDGFSFETVTDEYIYDKIDFYIDDFINKLQKDCAYISKRRLYLIKRLKGAIFKCFSLIKSHLVNSSFTPLGYEIRFDDKNIGCIEFDIGNGRKAKIRGTIDRSDVYHGEDGDYVRVIDYKTGNKDFSLSDVFYGLDIQLFVYLNALVESDEKYKYAGALYFKIDDPIFKGEHRYDEQKTEDKISNDVKMRGLLLDDEKLLEATDEITQKSAKKATYQNFLSLNKHLQKTISELCKEMAKGKIDIKPYAKGGFSPCQYCSFSSVCRFDSSKKGNDYDYLTSLKDQEVWDGIGGEQYVD